MQIARKGMGSKYRNQIAQQKQEQREQREAALIIRSDCRSKLKSVLREPGLRGRNEAKASRGDGGAFDPGARSLQCRLPEEWRDEARVRWQASYRF